MSTESTHYIVLCNFAALMVTKHNYHVSIGIWDMHSSLPVGPQTRGGVFSPGAL